MVKCICIFEVQQNVIVFESVNVLLERSIFTVYLSIEKIMRILSDISNQIDLFFFI